MEAGKLSLRVTLQTPERSTDGGGGATTSWTDVTTLWANLRTLGGQERSGMGGRQSEVTHDITIRHRVGVLPSMRFTHGTRIFNILAVLDDERRERLVCHCREEIGS